MKYLVTGGAGFIGSHIVERLLAEGHAVRVLDNLSTGSARNLEAVGSHPRLEQRVGDIRDDRDVAAAVQGVDGIFHLAALVSVQRSIEDPALCFDINARGSVNLLNAARRAGVKRMVLASSAAVYGDRNPPPVHESMTPAPISPYALDKLYMEHASSVYATLYGMHITLLRYFNVYGPRQLPDSTYSGVISMFLDRVQHRLPVVIYGDGMQTRDFVHVHDVARASALAMTTAGDGFRVLNVATGVATTVKTLADLVFRVCRRAVDITYAPARAEEIRHSCADVTLAGRLMGFRSEITIDAGLQMMCHTPS